MGVEGVFKWCVCVSSGRWPVLQYAVRVDERVTFALMGRSSSMERRGLPVCSVYVCVVCTACPCIDQCPCRGSTRSEQIRPDLVAAVINGRVCRV